MTDSGISVTQTRGLRLTVRCDFCGRSAEYAWLLFQSADGKNHVCNDCVCRMMQAMYDKMEEIESGVD